MSLFWIRTYVCSNCMSIVFICVAVFQQRVQFQYNTRWPFRIAHNFQQLDFDHLFSQFKNHLDKNPFQKFRFSVTLKKGYIFIEKVAKSFSDILICYFAGYNMKSVGLVVGFIELLFWVYFAYSVLQDPDSFDFLPKDVRNTFKQQSDFFHVLAISMILTGLLWVYGACKVNRIHFCCCSNLEFFKTWFELYDRMSWIDKC